MYKKLFFPLAVAAIAISCNQQPTANQKSDTPEADTSAQKSVTSEPENDAPEHYEKGGLKIYPFTGSPQYENASLKMNAPEDNAVIKNGKVHFDFTVDNYDLGTQTDGAGTNDLANSDKGQHIHLILDNDPYTAHYDPTFDMDIPMGHHIAIAFLSRSYHESVKNKNAYVVTQFTVGADKHEYEKANLKAPLLFYSRPKGEYKGADTKKVLFDFYLVNADLKPNGYSVIATINDSLNFEFDKWQPYIIEGLPMGENTISIKLVDANGMLVDSPVNTATRKFTLSK